MNKQEKNLLKGVIAGAAAGLVATFVMSKYQNISQDLFSNNGESSDKEKSEKSEPATVKAANAITDTVFDHELEKDEKEIAGQAMHYLMGGVSGAIYGGAAEYSNLVKKGGGFPFGTAVWAIADDFVVPALGLSKSPLKFPLSTHAYAITSHWVYGAVSELARKQIRKAI